MRQNAAFGLRGTAHGRIRPSESGPGPTRSNLIHWPLHARPGVAPIRLASPRRPELPNGGTALAVRRRAAGGLRATVAGGDGAPPSRAHAPRPLSRGDGPTPLEGLLQRSSGIPPV